MMIKELKDVLVLVERMPPDWQMKCVRNLSWKVRCWEERIQEPHLSNAEYSTLQHHRSQLRREARKRKKRGW